MTYDDMKNRIMGELKKVFRPEFLNRLDEVIVFHKLTKDEIKPIVELLIAAPASRWPSASCRSNLSEDAKDFLVEKGWDPAMGARPLRRAIQRYIEDPLADEVLSQSHAARARRSRWTGRRRATSARSRSRSARARSASPWASVPRAPRPRRARDEGGPEQSGGHDLPDEPEVLPDVPDAPPAEGDDARDSGPALDAALAARLAAASARTAEAGGREVAARRGRALEREREVGGRGPERRRRGRSAPRRAASRSRRHSSSAAISASATASVPRSRTGRRWRKRSTQW